MISYWLDRYLDVVFVHCSNDDLDNLQYTDVIAALRRMQEKGYVRYVGASTKTLAGGYYALDHTDIVMIPSEPNQIPILEKAWEKKNGIVLIHNNVEDLLMEGMVRTPIECNNIFNFKFY